MDKVFSSKRNGTELCKISKLKKKGKILKEIVNANLKLDKAKNFRPTTENFEESEQNYVQQRQYMQPQRPPQMDEKAAKWVSENPWYVDSSKPRLRKYAMDYHNDLANQYGLAFVGTDEYYNKINQSNLKTNVKPKNLLCLKKKLCKIFG